MARSGQSNGVDRTLVAIEVLVGFGVVAAIVGKAYGAATTTVFLLTGLSVAFTGFVLVRMFGALRDRSLDVTGRVEDEQRAALEHEKLLILQGIKELEADHEVGKVDPKDYAHLRGKAERDALAIIRTLKEEDDRFMRRAEDLVRERLGAAALPPPPAASSAVSSSAPSPAAKRTSAPANAAIAALFDDRPAGFEAKSGQLVCGACGASNPERARFCVGCGRPRAPEEAAA